MTRPRVTVFTKSAGPPRRSRRECRDGWRVFRSEADGYELAIPAYQVARVESIGARDRNEWHALAVGTVHIDDMGTHAVIRDFVPNDWAERGRAFVKVSPSAEAKVRELARELHPGLVPLGIIHTHPGYTTTPSTTDRKEFWSDLVAVSIIVDPSAKPSIAAYRGPSGERLVEMEPPTPAKNNADPCPAVLSDRPKPPLAVGQNHRVATPKSPALAVALGLALLLTIAGGTGAVAWGQLAAIRQAVARIEARQLTQPPVPPATLAQPVGGGDQVEEKLMCTWEDSQ